MIKLQKELQWSDDNEQLKLLKNKPKGKRPKFSKKSTEYFGGRIYFHKVRKCLRVYKRKSDKVEATVAIKSMKADDKEAACSYACALIENDPRPSK